MIAIVFLKEPPFRLVHHNALPTLAQTSSNQLDKDMAKGCQKVNECHCIGFAVFDVYITLLDFHPS